MNSKELRTIAAYADLELNDEEATEIAILLNEYYAEIHKLRELVLPDNLEPVVHYAIKPWG
jgi:hypothetical protein